MAAPVPVPASWRTDAAAAPFTLTAAARLVAGPAAAETADTAAATLAAATGMALPVTGRLARAGDVVLEVAGSGAAESYTLSADADGVRIVGADAAGAFYGVQTLAQLLEPTGGAWTVAATRIADRPRFGYRGVMLDVARHFFGVDVVTALIDRAAALKINMLHLHLSDDQGWRLQLASRPALAERASGTAVGGGAGGFFTAEDYTAIVAHAAARHVTVVPEVDGPGHTHAIGLAYPELAEDPAVTDDMCADAERSGGRPPRAGVPYTGSAGGFSSLRMHDERTYELLADVYGELARMTPGRYLHVGGDEPPGADPDDFAEYMTRVTNLVADLGKTPVAWHEAGAVPGISDDTVGQYWGFVVPVRDTAERARALVHNGGRLIMSPADAVYLDMKYDVDSPYGLDWANGPTDVRRSYRWEPTDVVPGITEEDILGVEAPLWTETVPDAAALDTQLLPRLASAAEIAWSPAQAPERTWESFRDRLGGLAPLWERQGVRFFRSPEIAWAAKGAPR